MEHDNFCLIKKHISIEFFMSILWRLLDQRKKYKYYSGQTNQVKMKSISIPTINTS